VAVEDWIAAKLTNPNMAGGGITVTKLLTDVTDGAAPPVEKTIVTAAAPALVPDPIVNLKVVLLVNKHCPFVLLLIVTLQLAAASCAVVMN
jgi:hypothetical protein